MQSNECAVCGAELRASTTDLPFKINDVTVVILKGLFIVQCDRCHEYLIEDEVLGRVDEILAKVESGTEIEIVRYAT